MKAMNIILFCLALGGGALVAGCADENDPKTWVKRLDDPAQRTPAVRRLSQFFEDTMTKANKNREAPEVTALLDTIIVPMTTTYTAGGLDDKSRKELMKSLADMRDVRTGPAIAKAFNEYEAGKNDEDVKYAAQAVTGLTGMGKQLDQNVVDALWNVFSHFQVSKAKSINLVTDLHDAVVAVKSPTYGPKAVERLSAPVDPKSVDSMKDEVHGRRAAAHQGALDAGEEGPIRDGELGADAHAEGGRAGAHLDARRIGSGVREDGGGGVRCRQDAYRHRGGRPRVDWAAGGARRRAQGARQRR
jgi:hypothetical protein